jgi:F420-non-reducing hydrogenase small subunit
MNTEAPTKLKLAVYWGAACGGCCVSVLDVHECLFEILRSADLAFWPVALDIKYNDVRALPDAAIDVTLFNGAVRNSENEEMARLLRSKSKLLVAYGSCAHLGGIPGLANLSHRDDILQRVFVDTPTTDNPDRVLPQRHVTMPEGELELPELYNDVRPLGKVVNVDYMIPGCPPQSERLLDVFRAIVSGAELPQPGSVIGANDKTLCDECTRTKTDGKLVKQFHRPQFVEDDGRTCLLEQGIICMGPATRSGCGSRCISGNAACRGCYGPPPELTDPGAKMMSALATMIDADDEDEIERIVDEIVDPAGTFYRFSVPSSLIRRNHA